MATRRKSTRRNGRSYSTEGLYRIGIPQYNFDPRKGDVFYLGGRKATVRGVDRDGYVEFTREVDGTTAMSKGNLYQASMVDAASRFAPYHVRKSNPRSAAAIPCRVIPNGKGGYRVFVTAKEAARLRVGNPRYGKGKNEPRDVFDKHMLRIARQTLKMSDIGARIMGGQTKEEAREIIRRLGGGEAEIRRLEQ